MTYHVKLNGFEGPLDLLLHLIQKNDLDLYDINLKDITDQYVDYIRTMQVLELNVAGEYLVMASTLLYMKSRLLLPSEEPEELYDELEAEEEWTKQSLMEKLVQYKAFKEAASDLKQKEAERSLYFTRPAEDLSAFAGTDDPAPELDVSLFDLIGAYQDIQKREKADKPYRSVAREEISIDSKMEAIVATLKTYHGKTTFRTLFADDEEESPVMTFLALLELMKNKKVTCEQARHFADIMIVMKGADSA
ncbi:segregation and condensation protein A [Alkalicoccus luteus]|uniref:segregation and condensation protein A n=1 Tax=Alkalicoccus luteus TaxID=1237094 RepID=UPI0040349A40